jgi:phosphatidylserine decarboxylase
MYGVNWAEIKEPLNSFRTFNQFFTRELVDNARPIDKEHDLYSLCSPCDGRILSFGDVDSKQSTVDCVKGANYRVDEFLFGHKVEGVSAIDRLIKSAGERGNKTMYLVVYLAPGDYHRYHSPVT